MISTFKKFFKSKAQEVVQLKSERLHCLTPMVQRNANNPDLRSPVYALNLFNVADRDEYLAYSRRSAKEVHAHGGRVIALGKFCEMAAGDINPRTVMILVEWASKSAFYSYCNDPKIADLHPHREKGASDYIWHIFDKLEDLRSILK